MLNRTPSSAERTSAEHAEEARRYLKWNAARAGAGDRLAYAQVQATLAIYELLKENLDHLEKSDVAQMAAPYMPGGATISG